jgi:hypothetical protein
VTGIAIHAGPSRSHRDSLKYVTEMLAIVLAMLLARVEGETKKY